MTRTRHSVAVVHAELSVVPRSFAYRTQRKAAAELRRSEQVLVVDQCTKRCILATAWTRLLDRFVADPLRSWRDSTVLRLFAKSLGRTFGGTSIKAFRCSAPRFTTILAGKARCAVGELIKVDAGGTSQECVCGATVRRTLCERTHHCPAFAGWCWAATTAARWLSKGEDVGFGEGEQWPTRRAAKPPPRGRAQEGERSRNRL